MQMYYEKQQSQLLLENQVIHQQFTEELEKERERALLLAKKECQDILLETKRLLESKHGVSTFTDLSYIQEIIHELSQRSIFSSSFYLTHQQQSLSRHQTPIRNHPKETVHIHPRSAVEKEEEKDKEQQIVLSHVRTSPNAVLSSADRNSEKSPARSPLQQQQRHSVPFTSPLSPVTAASSHHEMELSQHQQHQQHPHQSKKKTSSRAKSRSHVQIEAKNILQQQQQQQQQQQDDNEEATFDVSHHLPFPSNLNDSFILQSEENQVVHHQQLDERKPPSHYHSGHHMPNSRKIKRYSNASVLRESVTSQLTGTSSVDFSHVEMKDHGDNNPDEVDRTKSRPSPAVNPSFLAVPTSSQQPLKKSPFYKPYVNPEEETMRAYVEQIPPGLIKAFLKQNPNFTTTSLSSSFASSYSFSHK
jgi:hypothetical protein